MHPSRLLLALPLLLAACDQSPAPSATQAPADSPPAVETPTVPVDTASLFGTWAADLAWCDGAGEGTPITISATRFEGSENLCDITELADNGDGSFTANLSCTGEGQTVTERIAMTPVFAPTGEGVTLSYLDRGGEKVTVLRCK